MFQSDSDELTSRDQTLNLLFMFEECLFSLLKSSTVVLNCVCDRLCAGMIVYVYSLYSLMLLLNVVLQQDLLRVCWYVYIHRVSHI